MGFHLTPKKYYFPVEPWGMRMQWAHITLRLFYRMKYKIAIKIKVYCTSNLRRIYQDY